MCGIATISIGRRSRGRIPYPLLRKLTKELLRELQPRGMDASGIAVINDPDSGVDSIMFKKPLRPDRFVVRPRFDEVLSRIGPQTNFILLHSRATTAGSSSNNYNNHPIDARPIIGIHNGTLFNDDAIFKKFQDRIPREGTVDSEVIFRLYHYYTDRMGLGPKAAMAATSKELAGAYTGAMIDMRSPHRMVMFKFERSLALLRLMHHDIVLAISEVKFYDVARKRLGIQSKDQYQFVKDGTGFIMDVNEDGRITDNVINFDIPVDRTMRMVGGHNPWFAAGFCV